MAWSTPSRERRVLKAGHSFIAVTLPKPWAEAMNLHPGTWSSSTRTTTARSTSNRHGAGRGRRDRPLRRAGPVVRHSRNPGPPDRGRVSRGPRRDLRSGPRCPSRPSGPRKCSTPPGDFRGLHRRAGAQPSPPPELHRPVEVRASAARPEDEDDPGHLPRGDGGGHPPTDPQPTPGRLLEEEGNKVLALLVRQLFLASRDWSLARRIGSPDPRQLLEWRVVVHALEELAAMFGETLALLNEEAATIPPRRPNRSGSGSRS